MNATQSGNANGNSSGIPLVIVKVENGFKVYSPADPRNSYLVSGTSEDPSCTCAEFHLNPVTCQHIEAVRTSFGSNSAGEEDRYATEERLAIQNESGATDAASATQMLV